MRLEQFQDHMQYNLFVTVDFDICREHIRNTILILLPFVSSLCHSLCNSFLGSVHLMANIYHEHMGCIRFGPSNSATCPVHIEGSSNYHVRVDAIPLGINDSKMLGCLLQNGIDHFDTHHNCRLTCLPRIFDKRHCLLFSLFRHLDNQNMILIPWYLKMFPLGIVYTLCHLFHFGTR